jgi:hypothetical protein
MVRPVKKPPAKEPPENPPCPCLLSVTGRAVWDADAVEVVEEVGNTTGEGVGEPDADEDVLLASALHMPPLHENPTGQHWSPHFGRVTAVLLSRWIWLSG